MFCLYCGSFNRTGARFCKKCGESLKEEERIIDPLGVLGQEESVEEKVSSTDGDRPSKPAYAIQDEWHEEEEPIPSREDPLPEGLVPEELHPQKRHEEISTDSGEEVIPEEPGLEEIIEQQQTEEVEESPVHEIKEAIEAEVEDFPEELEVEEKEQTEVEPVLIRQVVEEVPVAENISAQVEQPIEEPVSVPDSDDNVEEEEKIEEVAEEAPADPVGMEEKVEEPVTQESQPEIPRETDDAPVEPCGTPQKTPRAKYKDSSKLTIPDEPEVPETLKFLKNGRYELIKQLGAGGTGRIFLAIDHKMGSNIVLKELCPLSVKISTLKYLEKRFKEEAKLLFRLTHTGFPRVMDYFTEKGRLLIVMQYIEGKNLFFLLKEQPDERFPMEQCLKWFDKMFELIAVLHRQDPPIIHRDIKPSNIMIDKKGRLYLVDFGFARALDPKGAMTRVGTYGYASPEHYSGNFSPTSDIFSLAATFHHLLTGEGPEKREDPFSYPPIYKYVPGFPREFQKIFDKMLAMSKSARYQSVDEVVKDFNKFKEMYSL
ncbi:MAG: protein kinase [Candidatus Eremiobacteraeota bacterium]|nr:protein kinase [Candidatus Eremiobacteraeota bacterium]